MAHEISDYYKQLKGSKKRQEANQRHALGDDGYRLFKAAPDLLAALERLDTATTMKMPPLFSDASPRYAFNEDDAAAIRKAIAKAKGGE